jgi:hypothetical protein
VGGWVGVCVCVWEGVYMYVYIHIHTCTYVYMYIYIDTHILMYICMYAAAYIYASDAFKDLLSAEDAAQRRREVLHHVPGLVAQVLWRH